ncbi:MAG: hypothetical protein QUU85_11615 [Candidatus Eisenbacteria bacterium]|nr:hypothetical protein [Candidatus Eisenbacteria bacterium]
MSAQTSKTCQHCGASGASMYADDGSLVCDRCFAYAKVVTADLRASQSQLGLTATGDAEHIVEKARSLGMWESLVAIASSGGAVACFVLAGSHPMGILFGSVLAVVALVTTVMAIRTMRFAKTEAPEIQKRASMPPPPSIRPPA